MTNPFYTASGIPVTGSPGASAGPRGEFALIQAGFDKMPAAFTANCAVIVNSGGTGLTLTVGGLALAGNLTTTGAFNTTLAQSASITLTLPGASGTLATLAGTEELTGKTLTSSVGKGTWTASGTWTLPAVTLGGLVTLGGSGQITAAGLLGLGMTPVLPLDITLTQNAISLANILNANGGNSAGAGWSASNNGGHSVVMRMHGTATTTSGLTVQNGGLIRASAGATGGLALDSGGGNLLLGVANTEGARLTSTGLQINTTSRSEALAVVGFNSANAVLDVFNFSAAASLLFTGPGNLTLATGANAGNACLYVNKDSTTLRSINSAGTNNAGGVDYAEYERKSDGCGQVAKGQIIGFDADGYITDKWALVASRFAVKTTNPSYVGGDVWGSEEALGLSRDDPGFAAALEAARQMVDRIAYCGKVPCNVLSAQLGDYIVPVQDGAGIKGVPVAVPTFDQYRTSVGRVVSLLPDGRCTIAVMVH